MVDMGSDGNISQLNENAEPLLNWANYISISSTTLPAYYILPRMIPAAEIKVTGGHRITLNTSVHLLKQGHYYTIAMRAYTAVRLREIVLGLSFFAAVYEETKQYSRPLVWKYVFRRETQIMTRLPAGTLA